MECRCYRGGEGRTRMKQLKLKAVDLVISIAFVVIYAGIIVADRLLTVVI